MQPLVHGSQFYCPLLLNRNSGFKKDDHITIDVMSFFHPPKPLFYKYCTTFLKLAPRGLITTVFIRRFYLEARWEIGSIIFCVIACESDNWCLYCVLITLIAVVAPTKQQQCLASCHHLKQDPQRTREGVQSVGHFTWTAAA